jgi:hypothetical protein
LVACLAGIAALSHAFPQEDWEAFFGDSYVSKFSRSGVAAISALMMHGYMESDAVVTDRLKMLPDATCTPIGKPPHIILVHDESSFDIRVASGIKVPAGYGPHFRSFDGRERHFIAEGAGGPSWYTEYNVLSGLSARSFGRFAYYVTRIAAGRVERGLPTALRRCGYRTFSIYPALGAFMGAKSFQTTTGVQQFFDQSSLGTDRVEPDRFYYDAARRMIERERGNGPMFLFVYLAQNHWPWDYRWQPDLMTEWQALGNKPEIDEYLRRQTMSFREYAQLVEHLDRDFPDESFLLVRYGDHQPDFATTIIEPSLDEATIAKRLMTNDPRYFTTYYAIDAVNFKPNNLTSALDTIDYYERMTKANGGADQVRNWSRLFLSPGMGHCANGPSLDSFDALSAIVDWVEKGVAPASLTATGNAFPGRSRPLCAYPTHAQYLGSGDIEDAANFACKAP